MTTLSTRDALAKALEREYGCKPGMVHEGYGTECDSHAHAPALYRTFGCDHVAHVADALIASGAVVDAVTLADDEALIYDELLPWCRSHEVERGAEVGSGIRHTLRALAAALTERSAS